MANLKKTELIQEVRRALDEVTLEGEVALQDAQMEDLASSNFSDEDLGDRLLDAVRYVAALVKPRYIPDLIEETEPARIPEHKVVRYLGSRITSGGVPATRRTFTGHRKMESSGVPTSEENPVYIIEDAEVVVFPDPVNGLAQVAFTTVPDEVGQLTSRLRTPIVQRCLTSCFQTLRLAEMAKSADEAFSQSIDRFVQPRQKTE